MYEYPLRGTVPAYFRLADGRVETTMKDSLITGTVTRATTAEGISTNGRLVRALKTATTWPFRPPAPPTAPPPVGRGRSGRRITGFAQA